MVIYLPQMYIVSYWSVSSFTLQTSAVVMACTDHSSKNVWNMTKNVRIMFFGFSEKTVKNVEVITYRPIGLKTMVTTINQFCFPSRNFQDQWTILI